MEYSENILSVAKCWIATSSYWWGLCVSRRFIGDQVFTSGDQVFISGVLQNHITKTSNLSNSCLKIPKSLLNAT